MENSRNLLIIIIAIQIIGFITLMNTTNFSNNLSSVDDSQLNSILVKLDDLESTSQSNQYSYHTPDEISNTKSLGATIRQIFKDEIKDAFHQYSKLHPETSCSNNDIFTASQDQLTPENRIHNETAMEASRTIIEQAISKSEWTIDDVNAMAPYVDNLTISQRNELIELYLQEMDPEVLSEGSTPPPL